MKDAHTTLKPFSAIISDDEITPPSTPRPRDSNVSDNRTPTHDTAKTADDTLIGSDRDTIKSKGKEKESLGMCDNNRTLVIAPNLTKSSLSP